MLSLRRRGLAARVVTDKPPQTDELLAALSPVESRARGPPVHYGERERDPLDCFSRRGARIEDLSLYEWALPVDVGPLNALIEDTLSGRIDAALFHEPDPVRHLLLVAESSGRATDLMQKLRADVVVGSSGRLLEGSCALPAVIPMSCRAANGPSLVQALATTTRCSRHPRRSFHDACRGRTRRHTPILIACFLHFDVCFMLGCHRRVGRSSFDGTHVRRVPRGCDWRADSNRSCCACRSGV
jgi:hypothetical protein